MPHRQLPVFFCFWFQKRKKINILGIVRDKSQSQYFTVGNTELEYETKGSHQGATPPGRVANPSPRLGGCGHPGCPCLSSLPIIIPRYQNLKYLIDLPRNS